MAHLFLGKDRKEFDEQISELKDKIIGSQDCLGFDYEVLYGHKLDSDTLKKALIALPAIAKQRLVVLYDFHKLSAHNKEIIIEFLDSQSTTTELVLLSDSVSSKDSFVKKIKASVKITESGSKTEENVFDMTRAIDMRRAQDALMVLSNMLKKGVHPLQVMGGVIWFWGKCRTKISKDRFYAGLKAIEETDLNIKRSRFKPDYAVELLVVKLCSLR